MSEAQNYRRQVDEMLRLAAKTTDLGERGRYIDKAIALQRQADIAEGKSPPGGER